MWLNLSVWPLHCGCLGAVLDLRIPRRWHMFLNRSLSKFLPWSLCRSMGHPKRHTTSLMMHFAHVSAVWSFMGNTSTHFVNESVTTNIQRLSHLLSGNGPNMSTHKRSIGAPTRMSPILALGRLVGFLTDAHISHLLNQIFTSSAKPNQWYLCSIFSIVFFLPRWPPFGELCMALRMRSLKDFGVISCR